MSCQVVHHKYTLRNIHIDTGCFTLKMRMNQNLNYADQRKYEDFQLHFIFLYSQTFLVFSSYAAFLTPSLELEKRTGH